MRNVKLANESKIAGGRDAYPDPQEEGEEDFAQTRAMINKKMEELRILQARIDKRIGKSEGKEAIRQGFVDGQ